MDAAQTHPGPPLALSLAYAAAAAPLEVSDAVRRAGLAALAIDVVALASVWRSRAHSVKAKLLWTVLVALLPVLGAAAWFVLGRERRDARRGA